MAESIKGKWAFSTNEESYGARFFNSKEECIAEAEHHSARFWVGQCAQPAQPETLFDWHAIERWLDADVWSHDDYGSPCAEGAVDPTLEQMNELAAEIRPLIAAWLDRHGLRPTHFVIDSATIEQIEASQSITTDARS